MQYKYMIITIDGEKTTDKNPMTTFDKNSIKGQMNFSNVIFIYTHSHIVYTVYREVYINTHTHIEVTHMYVEVP